MWDKVRVITVDKTFSEIVLLQTALPAAWTLLCAFHVVQYFRGEVTKRDYGLFDREKLEDAAHTMLSAQTEGENETGRKHLCYVGRVSRLL